MRLGRWPVVAFALVSAVGLAACGSSAKPAAAPATSEARGTPTTAKAGTCQPASGYTPGTTTTHQITVDGMPREFLVHLPPRPAAAMRLIVDLHGAGSVMRQQEAYSAFDPLADAQGFVMTYPNGQDAAIRQWNFLKLEDVDFAKSVVATLVKDACVDPAHAYAVGISSGGAMTAALACRASDTFAGFGPVAGDFYSARYCGPARQRPMIIFHGTADPAVPYNGGTVANSRGLPVQAAEAVAAQWAEHNGCTSGPTEAPLGTEVVRLTWNGCVAPVVMYRIVGGGHVWPGSPIDVAGLGMTTKQVSATDEMWKFFAAN